jgi:hypothetical protein
MDVSGPLRRPPPDALAIATNVITNTICNSDAVTRSQRPGKASSRRASPNRRRTKRPIAANMRRGAIADRAWPHHG